MLITYINFCQKLCKSALRYQAEAFDLKLWIEHVRREQTRNGFSAGRVRQHNGAKPSKT
jgi:hypothetical protein